MLETMVERLGEVATLALGAMIICVLFGFMAQRSRFCLRSAVIEFARNQLGGKLTVWLFAFATAVGATQALAWAGWFDASKARQIATRGSLSGAAIGAARDLIARTGIGRGGALVFAVVWLVAAVFWTQRQWVPVWGWAGAIGVGLAIAAAWWFTYAVSKIAFDPHPIQSLSFTGPLAEVLNRVLFVTNKPLSFDAGLVPGVFLGGLSGRRALWRTQA